MCGTIISVLAILRPPPWLFVPAAAAVRVPTYLLIGLKLVLAISVLIWASIPPSRLTIRLYLLRLLAGRGLRGPTGRAPFVAVLVATPGFTSRSSEFLSSVLRVVLRLLCLSREIAR